MPNESKDNLKKNKEAKKSNFLAETLQARRERHHTYISCKEENLYSRILTKLGSESDSKGRSQQFFRQIKAIRIQHANQHCNKSSNFSSQ